MPRISLWNPNKTSDFEFADKAIGENFRISGSGILVHMYEGPTTDSKGSTDTSLTTIQDVLFLSNSNRKYNPNVIELRGHYTVSDVTFDLSQFGVFLSSDVLRIQFHYNDMVDALGRKLISGDVLELPALRDTPIFDNAVGINRYYVVQDALYAGGGYGNKWFPHIWMVRAKMINASPEYKDIIDSAASGATSGLIGQGLGIVNEGFSETVDGSGDLGYGCNGDIKNSLDLFCTIAGITKEIVEEAEENVFFDPKFFENANLYIYLDKSGYPVLGSSTFFSGDGSPPNQGTDLEPGGKMRGAGIMFPEDMQDGEYYLRLDYTPERLFQKQGNKFKLIEVNLLKTWTAYNRVLDTFIDNINDTKQPDGTVVSEKQPLDIALKQKVDLYASRKQSVSAAENQRKEISDQRSRTRGY